MSDEPVMYNTSYDQPPPVIEINGRVIVAIHLSDMTCTIRNADGTTSVVPIDDSTFANLGCVGD